MSQLALENALENLYADRVRFVSSNTIRTYAECDDTLITSWLGQWESDGRIRVLKRLSVANDTEKCVELLSGLRDR